MSAPVTVRQQNRRGDRLEVRELAVSSDLNEWAQWPGLAQVGRLTCLRRRKGQTTVETSYIITSLSPQQATPAQLLHLVRGHWGIENRLHWVRDLTFDEDRCLRVRDTGERGVEDSSRFTRTRRDPPPDAYEAAHAGAAQPGDSHPRGSAVRKDPRRYCRAGPGLRV